MIEKFVGHRSEVALLSKWLQDFFQKKPVDSNYVIIYSTTGNGKTFLPTLLAQDMDAELYSICANDVEKQTDIYSWVKKVNTTPLNTIYKLILVDDLEEFSESHKKILMEMVSLSRYPIIYTSNIYDLPYDFKNKSIKNNNKFIVLCKPLTSELKDHLSEKAKEQNIDISEDDIYTIAEQSKSVRSAELSLYYCKNVNTSVEDILETGNQFLQTIKKQQLCKPITRKNINFIFDNIKGYDKYALKVMKLFADFDYRIKVQFQEIDPIFVNEAIGSFEHVDIFYEFKPKFENNKKEQNLEKPKVERKTMSLDKWGL